MQVFFANCSVNFHYNVLDLNAHILLCFQNAVRNGGYENLFSDANKESWVTGEVCLQ